MFFCHAGRPFEIGEDPKRAGGVPRVKDEGIGRGGEAFVVQQRSVQAAAFQGRFDAPQNREQ